MKTIAALTMVFLPATFVAVSTVSLTRQLVMVKWAKISQDIVWHGLLHHRCQLTFPVPNQFVLVDLPCSDDPTYLAYGQYMAGMASMGPLETEARRRELRSQGEVVIGFPSVMTLIWIPKCHQRCLDIKHGIFAPTDSPDTWSHMRVE